MDLVLYTNAANSRLEVPLIAASGEATLWKAFNSETLKRWGRGRFLHAAPAKNLLVIQHREAKFFSCKKQLRSNDFLSVFSQKPIDPVDMRLPLAGLSKHLKIRRSCQPSAFRSNKTPKCLSYFSYATKLDVYILSVAAQ